MSKLENHFTFCHSSYPFLNYGVNLKQFRIFLPQVPFAISTFLAKDAIGRDPRSKFVLSTWMKPRCDSNVERKPQNKTISSEKALHITSIPAGSVETQGNNTSNADQTVTRDEPQLILTHKKPKHITIQFRNLDEGAKSANTLVKDWCDDMGAVLLNSNFNNISIARAILVVSRFSRTLHGLRSEDGIYPEEYSSSAEDDAASDAMFQETNDEVWGGMDGDKTIYQLKDLQSKATGMRENSHQGDQYDYKDQRKYFSNWLHAEFLPKWYLLADVWLEELKPIELVHVIQAFAGIKPSPVKPKAEFLTLYNVKCTDHIRDFNDKDLTKWICAMAKLNVQVNQNLLKNFQKSFLLKLSSMHPTQIVAILYAYSQIDISFSPTVVKKFRRTIEDLQLQELSGNDMTYLLYSIKHFKISPSKTFLKEWTERLGLLSLETLKPQQLAGVVYNLSYLGYKVDSSSSSLVPDIVATLTHKMVHLEDRLLSNFLLGLVHMKVALPGVFLKLWEDAIFYRMETFSSQSLSVIIHSLGLAKKCPSDHFMQQWFLCTSKVVNDMDAQELYLSIQSLHLLEIPMKESLKRIWLGPVESKICQLSDGALSKIMHYLVSLNFDISKESYVGWLTRVEDRLWNLRASQLTCVLLTASKLKHLHKPAAHWMVAWYNSAKNMMNEFSGSDLVDVVLALCNLEGKNRAEGLKAFLGSWIEFFEDKLKTMTPRVLVRSLSGFAQLSWWIPKRVYNTWYDCALNSVDQFTPNQRSRAFYYLSKCRSVRLRPDFEKIWIEKMRQELKSMDDAEYFYVLFGLSKIRKKNTEYSFILEWTKGAEDRMYVESNGVYVCQVGSSLNALQKAPPLDFARKIFDASLKHLSLMSGHQLIDTLYSMSSLGFHAPGDFLRTWLDLVQERLARGSIDKDDLVQIIHGFYKIGYVPPHPFYERWMVLCEAKMSLFTQADIARCALSITGLDLRISDQLKNRIQQHMALEVERNGMIPDQKILLSLYLSLKRFNWPFGMIPYIMIKKGLHLESMKRLQTSNFVKEITAAIQRITGHEPETMKWIECIARHVPIYLEKSETSSTTGGGGRTSKITIHVYRVFDLVLHCEAAEKDDGDDVERKSETVYRESGEAMFERKLLRQNGFVSKSVSFYEWGALKNEEEMAAFVRMLVDA